MTINCRGLLLDLSTPKVMGILNVTPNSFYDGGRFQKETEILNQVAKMLEEGASFIDLGVYSSKPNADFVSEADEVLRILPIVKLLQKHFPDALLSIDTFRSEVAKVALDHGAALINDISAGNLDGQMMATIASYQVPYIMMHMKGTPQTMATLTQYDNIVKEMLFYFSEKVAEARSHGINDLLLDPGFGFAKTINQNYEVLQNMELFQFLELPILVGVSRKSMVHQVLQSTAQEALNGTTVLNTLALTKGAKILRVHDVKEGVECIQLFNKMNSTKP